MKTPFVLYDHKCGLCKKEILFYKKKDKTNIINWADIHENKESLGNYNLDFDQAMKSFHFIDEKNKQFKGVDAFIKIYQYLPGWKLAAKILSFPGIYHLATLGYRCFAFIRYRFHGYHKCNI